MRTVHPRQILLGLGVGELAGELAAIQRMPGEQPDSLAVKIVGDTASEMSQPVSLPVAESQLWAPTRSALGEQAWGELQSQRITIVGAGRTGSLFAESLHRIGAQLTLIDMDHIEPHNVGESMLINSQDVGQAKPFALARRLLSTFPEGRPVKCIEASAESLASLPAIRDCSLLVTAVDNPAARLFCSLLAQLYLIPLLDLGTGIEFSAPEPGSSEGAQSHSRTMGADIRLCLPDRCLLCTGGLPDLPTAVSGLLKSDGSDRPAGAAAWYEQRSGSLRSLNGCAVSLGLRLLEDWFAARLPVGCNRLLQLKFESDGTPTLRTTEFSHLRITDCPICDLGGRGDPGLQCLRSVLKKIYPGDDSNTSR